MIRIAVSSPVWLDCCLTGTLMLRFRRSSSLYQIPRPAAALSLPLLMQAPSVKTEVYPVASGAMSCGTVGGSMGSSAVPKILIMSFRNKVSSFFWNVCLFSSRSAGGSCASVWGLSAVGFHLGCMCFRREDVVLMHSEGWGHFSELDSRLHDLQMQFILRVWLSGTFSRRDRASRTSLMLCFFCRHLAVLVL